jgi:hypothetical protein
MGNVVDLPEFNYVTIKEPVQVVQIPPRAANDSGSIAFSPFLDYTNEFRSGIQIQKNDILTTTTPILELENQYNSIFGSGIQIAKTL